MKEIKQLQIGKNKLTQALIDQAKKMFEKEKAIKVVLLQSATRDKKEAKEMAEKLIAGLGEHFQYTLIGYTLIVKKKRIKQGVFNKD